MKRQDKYPNTDTFEFFNANPKNRINANDCAIRAISTAMCKEWNYTLKDMTEMSLKTGWMVNDKKGIETYLTTHGWVKRSQPRKPDGTKYTGKEFCKEIAKPNSTYIANIGGHHIVCIRNKKVLDTWDSTDGTIGNYYVL